MAGPVMELDRPFHVRSISMPSSPQPVLKIEEELQKLRAYMAPSTYISTPQMICNGLRELGDLYNCIKDVLQLSPFNLRQKNWVEEELDHSIRLLDLCALVRDTLVALKEHARDLSLSLRRKDAVRETKLHAKAISAKKTKKEMKKCLKSLKQNEKKFTRPFSPCDKNCDVFIVVKMFMEARELTFSLIHSVLPSLSELKMKPKERKWSFVSNALQQRKVVCENEDELAFTCEVENLEFLEMDLECLFKNIVQYRVSLLNTISL